MEGTLIRFSFSTLERWYYAARKALDPVAVLRRASRDDAGRSRTLSTALIQALEEQYRLHTGWTIKLHYDNLQALSQEVPSLYPLPSYATIRRYMKAQGYHRKRRPINEIDKPSVNSHFR